MADLRIIEDWITTIREEGKNLTSWEAEFIESMYDKLTSNRPAFSDRQIEVIERIYAEKTPT